ncbi:unnamed protein product [Ceutorhynchus assimilis]|uniref:CIDE-N domain-containing protein n=1 Tax=Ceutorhynchus assimilis TaxID=467358 RepID=A0A9N9MGG9_9CUCU|nr:unnamed protein product [Ceutorhynchus assimilis]
MKGSLGAVIGDDLRRYQIGEFSVGIIVSHLTKREGTMVHLFKVVDSRRENRVMVIIKDEADIYGQLIWKASLKLQKNGDRLALEKDGTIIDEEEILLLLENEILMLLEEGEKWRAPVPIEGAFCQTERSVILETSPSKNSSILRQNPEQDNPNIPRAVGFSNSQVNLEVWKNFNIPWSQMSTFVEARLKKKVIDKRFIQFIIDEMRTITPKISIKACRIIAAKVIQKYPDVFKAKDKNGHQLASKLLDRNNYLNRPHKTALLHSPAQIDKKDRDSKLDS